MPISILGREWKGTKDNREHRPVETEKAKVAAWHATGTQQRRVPCLGREQGGQGDREGAAGSGGRGVQSAGHTVSTQCVSIPSPGRKLKGRKEKKQIEREGRTWGRKACHDRGCTLPGAQ